MALHIAAPKQEQSHLISSLWHHSAPLQAVILCTCFFTQCLQPVEINPRVSDPRTTHGLIEGPLPHAMALHIAAPKQEQSHLISSHRHHSAPLQALIQGTCFFTQCLQPVEINPRVSDPPTTHGLIEGPLPHAMALHIAAPKQERSHLISSHLTSSLWHHSAPLQAVILCTCFFTQCLQPEEINPRVSDLQTTDGLFEQTSPHAMGSKTLGLISTSCRHCVNKRPRTGAKP